MIPSDARASDRFGGSGLGSILSRAQEALLGQPAGDSFGSLAEFQAPSDIQAAYPRRICNLADGGTWGTLVGWTAHYRVAALK